MKIFRGLIIVSYMRARFSPRVFILIYRIAHQTYSTTYIIVARRQIKKTSVAIFGQDSIDEKNRLDAKADEDKKWRQSTLETKTWKSKDDFTFSFSNNRLSSSMSMS